MLIVLFICIALTALVTWMIASYVTAARANKKLFASAQELAASRAQIDVLREAAAQARDTEQQLARTFESLSSRVLRDNSSAYLEQARQHLHRVIDPLVSDMNKLEKHIVDMEKSRQGAYSSIESRLGAFSAEIQHLQKTNTDLRMSAEGLRSALKSEGATRGKWGEIQLRRIAELSGMVEHIDFEEQVHTVSESGQILRPDMVIRLPHEGVVPVDAKVPMSAYLQACESADPAERKALMDRHKDALKMHVKKLSAKEYWQQFAVAPQIVVLFLPYESGLEASFAGDPQLLDDALDKKVIVAGPSTLYAFLKVISYGWMQVELSKNARTIADASKELLGRFYTFSEHYAKIGADLGRAVSSYNSATSSLQARLLPKLRDIEQLRGGGEQASERDFPLIDKTVKE